MIVRLRCSCKLIFRSKSAEYDAAVDCAMSSARLSVPHHFKWYYEYVVLQMRVMNVQNHCGKDHANFGDDIGFIFGHCKIMEGMRFSPPPQRQRAGVGAV